MNCCHRHLVTVLLLLALIGCAPRTNAQEPEAVAPPKARSPDEVLVAGEWSAAVNGLRARLLVGEDNPCNGTRMAKVYLELQNVSDVGNPMAIYFDTAHSPLKYEMLDSHGNVIPQAPTICDILTSGPYWIHLPFDSILRFRVSVTGYGIPKDGGLAIGLDGGFWLISPKAPGDYYLSGSFRVTPPKDASGHPWQGVLELPKAKIQVR